MEYGSQPLPEHLSVLFVDDDPILRKLFARTIRTVAPSWEIREASNGEVALKLVDEYHFDLIFVDMYMASVEKQLLGTETVAAMRNKGLKCRICGQSANDKEDEFIEAGADSFTYKPFPCEAKALTNELRKILFKKSPQDEIRLNESNGLHV
jgi:CheY-like chemotaxis protein